MEIQNHVELASVIIAMVSALSAAYSARQSKKAVDITLNGISSQLLQSQSEKYVSEKMKKSIRLLVNFYKKYKDDDFAKKFVEEQKVDQELDEARRSVKFYFVENYNLLMLNVFNLKHLRILAWDHNVCVLIHIIRPIENKFLKDYRRDDDMYSFYMKNYPNATEEKIGF